MEYSQRKYVTLSSLQPTVSFDLIYSYTYLLIAEVIFSTRNKNKRAGMMLDYFLRFTLKKTNGDRKSFTVSLVKYINTMHVHPHTGDITFTLNLTIAEENLKSGLYSQEAFCHFVEISLEHGFTHADKDIEFTLCYQDCDGLELNK